MTYKQKICEQIIQKMEWWRNASWASHIDERTKDEVITVMQNVVDGTAHNRQRYKAETKMGKWIELDSCMTVCSECNTLGCGTRYCANCGAKMEVE